MAAADNTNPIVSFTNPSNLQVWGSPNLQRTVTALDQVGIRRLLLIIEKRIQALWAVGGNVENAIGEFILDLMERKAHIEDFDIVTDETGCMLYLRTPAQWIVMEVAWKGKKGSLCNTLE